MAALHELAIGASGRGVLIRMYDTLYDRRPDLEGLNDWLRRSEAGSALAASSISQHSSDHDQEPAAFTRSRSCAFTSCVIR